MKKLLKKMFYMGVDLTAQSVDKFEATVKKLVDQEEISAKRGEEVIAKFVKKTEKNKDYLENKIEEVLKKVNIKTARKGIKDVLNEDELKDSLNLEGDK